MLREGDFFNDQLPLLQLNIRGTARETPLEVYMIEMINNNIYLVKTNRLTNYKKSVILD